MSKKTQITREQLKRIIRSELNQYEGTINEGIWDSLKHMVSKWGSLEKGGKLVGKDKFVDKAEKQFQASVEKESNKAVKQLIAKIKEEHPEFPNQKDQWEFQSAIADVAMLYDSLAAGVAKYKDGVPEDKQEGGSMAPDVANGVVHSLRTYVRILLDRDLADVYKHFKEQIDNASDEKIIEIKNALIENDMWNQKLAKSEALKPLAEINWEEEAAKLDEPEGGEDKPAEEEDEDVLGVGKAGKEGSGKLDSGTIKGLKSNALPMMLGLLGGASLAAHQALLSTVGGPELVQWDAIYKDKTVEEIGPSVEKIMGQDLEISTKGHGLLHLVNKAGGGNDPMNLVANVDEIAEVTGRSPVEVIQSLGEQVGKKGNDTAQALEALYNYQSQGGNVSDFVRRGMPSKQFVEFVKDNYGESFASKVAVQNAGTGFPGDASLLGINVGKWNILAQKVVVPTIVKYTQKKLVRAGGAYVGTTAVGGSAALASSGLLSMLGIAGVTAGAAIGLIRAKGRKSSRAQVLDDLEKSLKYFEAASPLGDPEEFEEDPPITDPTPDPEPGPDEEPPEEDGEIPGPPPEEPLPPEDPKKRLGLARMDKEATKLHIGSRRSQKGRDMERDQFQKAQSQGVTGREDSPYNDPSVDDLGDDFSQARRGTAPSKATYDKIVKQIKGRSRRDPEPYFTVDASFIKDAFQTVKGRDVAMKGKAKAVYNIGKDLLASFVDTKKKASAEQATDIIKKYITVDLPEDRLNSLVDVLKDYGLVESGEEVRERPPRRTRRRPGTGRLGVGEPAPQPVKGDDEGGTTFREPPSEQPRTAPDVDDDEASDIARQVRTPRRRRRGLARQRRRPRSSAARPRSALQRYTEAADYNEQINSLEELVKELDSAENVIFEWTRLAGLTK